MFLLCYLFSLFSVIYSTLDRFWLFFFSFFLRLYWVDKPLISLFLFILFSFLLFCVHNGCCLCEICYYLSSRVLCLFVLFVLGDMRLSFVFILIVVIAYSFVVFPAVTVVCFLCSFVILSFISLCLLSLRCFSMLFCLFVYLTRIYLFVAVCSMD